MYTRFAFQSNAKPKLSLPRQIIKTTRSRSGTQSELVLESLLKNVR
jgi:hypothetical protein